jgi:UDP-glucose 4-epimerase
MLSCRGDASSIDPPWQIDELLFEIHAMNTRPVLITGAGGYLGSQLLAALVSGKVEARRIVAVDVRDISAHRRLPGVEYYRADIRSAELTELFKSRMPEVVVHLASIVTPGKHSNREFEYSVDVLGTENVLKACLAAGIKKIIVTSSGAAYGYHPDNPAWITEDWRLRGNETFAYAHHKRLVEEMLSRWRIEHAELQQVVLRVGTILGETVHNQITDLFEKPLLLAIRGSDSPFVFIWDQDVVGSILHAISTDKTGIYNVAGDGALTIFEIAARLGKRCVALPAGLIRAALATLKMLHLTQYGPEQVDFLRYRPVLDNHRLKHEFGYVPRKTSSEAFDFWRTARDTRDGDKRDVLPRTVVD